MTTLVDTLFTFLKPEELQIECLVRGINTKDIGCENKLRSVLNSELTKKSSIPIHTHVNLTEAVEEIQECAVISDYLIKTTHLMNIQDTDLEEVRPLLAKAKHWSDRCVRVKNSHGEIGEVSKYITQFRRHLKFLASIIEYQENLRKKQNTRRLSGNPNVELPLSEKVQINAGPNVDTFFSMASQNMENTKEVTKSPCNFSEKIPPTSTHTSPQENLNAANNEMLRNTTPYCGTIHKGTRTSIVTNPNFAQSQIGLGTGFSGDSVGHPGLNESQSIVHAMYSGNSQNDENIRSLSEQRRLSLQQSELQNLNSEMRAAGISGTRGNMNLNQDTDLTNRRGSLSPPRSIHPPSFNYEPEYPRPENAQSNLRLNIDPRLHDFRYVPKWNITFDGTDGLEVNDFIYKIEETARCEYFPFEQIPRILPHFVKNKALEWLWTFRRMNPGSNWSQIRTALMSRYCSSESEIETRILIQQTHQGGDESINDFILKIESYNSKLNTPFLEAELVRILRNNMKTTLQNATLLFNFQSVEQLRSSCSKYEKLWLKSRQQHRTVNPPVPVYRGRANVNEVYFTPNYDNLYHAQDQCLPDLPDFSSFHISEVEPDPKPHIISEVLRRQDTKTNQNLICWNCKDLGHTYWECLQPLSEFCYGCGKSDVRLPNCPRCKEEWLRRKSGNVRPNVMRPRENRSVPIALPSGTKPSEDVATNTEPPRHR